MYKLFSILFLFLAASCSNTEIGDSDDISPDAIAQQIDINYSPELGLTAQARFRVSGINGTTLVLNKPAKVALNGDVLSVDSTGSSGAFYKKTISTAVGSHTFVYTDKDGKTYKNSFAFNGYALAKELPSIISKTKDLEVEFKGLDANAKISYNISDTSFGNDVNEKQNLVNNKLFITAKQMEKLHRGLITIEFIHQRKEPLKQGTKEGGEINYLFQMKKIKVKLQ